MSEWNDRFSVLLECKACKAVFESQRPDPSRELLNGGTHRLILVGAPDECPSPRCAKARASKVVDIRPARPAG